MDYLRSIGSVAVSSLVSKSGLNFPFNLGEKIEDNHKNNWSLFDGTKKDDSSAVSIFVYDSSVTGRKAFVPLAKNALRKLRTTRHPDVLKFMEVVETEGIIYIMTERVRPLSSALKNWHSKPTQGRDDWLIWGLHRISVALAFVNESCSSTHGNIRPDSIFVSPSGEWKLGGFEVLSSPKDDAAVLYTMGTLLPDIMSIAPPEVQKTGWSVAKDHDPSAPDAYALGILIHTLFNPSHPLPTTSPPHAPPTPSSRGSIPKSIFPSFKRLLNPSPKARLSPKGFLELGMAETAGEGSGFFTKNPLVKVCEGLDGFAIASEADKTLFLRSLKDSEPSLPPEFASNHVLPSLVSALEFGGPSAASILPLVLQLGKNVPPQEYSALILNPLVKLFSSPDRGTRMALLDHLAEYVEVMDKKTVCDKIWPNLQTGFTDTVAVIREATVKSIILLAPKLNERVLNNELLRHLAKAQSDTEPSIRTNTCILLGRLGPTLGYNTKRKILVPAFSLALKDGFVHARVAGIMAFMACVDCFEIDEIAGKVVPSVSPSMVDKEKLVRDQAFKAVEFFVKKLEEYAASMPETVIVENGSMPASTNPQQQGQATIVSSAAGAAGALAGWAISSLGKKLAATDLQTNINNAAGVSMDRPTSAPPPLGNTPSSSSTASLGRPSPFIVSSTKPTLSTPNIVGAPAFGGSGSGSRAKGMQLGANKIPGGFSSSLVDELEAEAGSITEANNPWGNGDLMDVNADEDDWSAFETAPPPVVQPKPVRPSGLNLQHGSSSTHHHDEWNLSTAPQARTSQDSNSWDAPSPPDSPPVSTRIRRTTSPLRSPLIHASSSRRSSNVSSPPEGQPSLLQVVEDKRSVSPAPQTPSTAGMSKEEKAAEMLRRKEERKQRIAQLKEQKKNAAGAKS